MGSKPAPFAEKNWAQNAEPGNSARRGEMDGGGGSDSGVKRDLQIPSILRIRIFIWVVFSVVYVVF